MSSPIHSAACVARDGTTVAVELAPTPACGAHFPLSQFFGLALLHECATTIVYSAPGQVLHFGRTATPLGLAVTADEVLDLGSEPAVSVRKRVLADTFIRAVDYVGARNWAPGKDDLQATFDRALRSCRTERDPDARARLERQRLPHATLRIEATDEQWVSHVDVGMVWDVHAFDDDAMIWPVWQ